jgi:adapter protein MecA 1/2
MKIEKVNDHQIRCTLTKSDLADRELKISELAYGSDKAKDLFRDMMQQASYEFGFEAEDIPLMIEAIPINNECIVLIITKVEDPEELDTRFSKFAPSVHDEEELIPSIRDARDEVLDLFQRINEDAIASAPNKSTTSSGSSPQTKDVVTVPAEVTYIFTFLSIGDLARGAHIVADWYTGESSLYKDDHTSHYKLILRIGNASTENYNKACNILNEYGKGHRFSDVGNAYFEEHYEALCKHDALQALAMI